jgi:hypothetical protein
MASDEPVHLTETAETGDRFLIYATDGGAKVEVRYEGDTLWMTQAQMANLFGRDVSVISRHIANVLEDGELPTEGDLHFLHIRGPGNRPVMAYSLDMVISVGYRVSSREATLFRRWATSVLVRFATKGFVVDVERLKSPENYDRVAELREIIRDIRASEANVYAELRRICAMCQDYDGQSKVARDFYQTMQTKLFWAVTTNTPAMVLKARANATEPNMGLQIWPKTDIRQQDVTTAKNYLGSPELQELNRLTTLLLDIFDDQLKIGRLTLMSEATELLEEQLKNLRRAVLRHGGNVTHTAAVAFAKAQYAKFDKARKMQRRAEVAAQLANLKQQTLNLPDKPPRKRGKIGT